MKKLTALLMALMLAVCGCSVALAVNEDVEGEVAIYTSMYVYDMIDEALRREFPNVTPAGTNGSFFIYGNSGDIMLKVRGEMEIGKALECDMFMLAEPAFSLELKEKGYLHAFEIEDAQSKLRFPYDEEGYWYPVRVCNMVLACNPDLEADWAKKGVNIPKSFHDFAYDPTLKGYIAMNNPKKSGTAYAAIVALLDKYGEEYFDMLKRNRVMYDASGSAAIAKVQSGECAAVMILEESVLKYMEDEEKRGNTVTSLKVIYPEDGVILIPSTVMIVADEYSAHVNSEAAEAVAQWLLTEEAQELIMQAYMHSVLSGEAKVPYHSVDTDGLIANSIPVDWEKAFREETAIKNLWDMKVTQ